MRRPYSRRQNKPMALTHLRVKPRGIGNDTRHQLISAERCRGIGNRPRMAMSWPMAAAGRLLAVA